MGSLGPVNVLLGVHADVWSGDDENMFAPVSWLSSKGFRHRILPGKFQESLLLK